MLRIIFICQIRFDRERDAVNNIVETELVLDKLRPGKKRHPPFLRKGLQILPRVGSCEQVPSGKSHDLIKIFQKNVKKYNHQEKQCGGS